MKDLNGSSGKTNSSRNSSQTNLRLEETLRRLGWANCILFESGDENVSVHDTEYNICRISKSIERMFGKDVVGQKCYRAYHNRDTICPGCLTEKLLTTGQIVCSGEQINRDRTYSIQSFPLADEQGNVVAIVEHATDITENKKAEKKLKETTIFWNTVFNTVNDAVAVINVVDFTIVEANYAFLETYGLGREQVIGKTCHEVTHHELTPCCGPEHGCPLLASVASGQYSAFEHIHYDKKGKELVFEVSAAPIGSGQSGINQVVHVARNITERKRSAEKYQRVIETSMDGFFIMDREGHFLEVNDSFCRLIGYSREELMHMAVRDIEAAETPEEVSSHIQKVKDQGIDRFETRNRRKSGEIVDVEISTHYLESGQLFAFVHDITARKRAQLQLMMNDRLASIGLLAAGIAHEIGNPLTVIAGYANTLPLLAELPDEVRDGLKIIEDQVQRAGDILGNLLVFARSDRLEKEPLSINESIWRVLKLRAHDRKVNKIELNTSLDTNLPKIMGNRSKLEQVFYNIVTNAEFSMSKAHQNGNLTVKSEQTDKVVRITFADDGMGISREILGRIFTPFFTTKEVGEGTGLGLSICQGIVTEHNGRLWAESTEGKGAAFIVELPALGSGNRSL